MTPTRPLKRRGRDWARAGRGTSLRALERELVQKAKQRLDETIAQIRAAASWTCSDGSLDADWQRYLFGTNFGRHQAGLGEVPLKLRVVGYEQPVPAAAVARSANLGGIQSQAAP